MNLLRSRELVCNLQNAWHQPGKQWYQEISNTILADLRGVLQRLRWLKTSNLRIARSLLEDNQTIATLKAENYDLVLRDALSWPALLPPQILGIPYVDVLTTGVLQPLFGPRYSIPNPIAYLPQMISASPPNAVRSRYATQADHLL